MSSKTKPPANTIVFTCIGALHLLVGLCLFVGLPIQNISSIASVTKLIGVTGTAILMTTIGTLALCSMLASQRYVAFGLLVSQQVVLIASGVAGIVCAIEGHYADGTLANSWHIGIDQSPYFALMVIHSAAILQTHADEVWEWLWS